MRIAIVGASGVLGSRVVMRARDEGHDVRPLVRSEEAAAKVGPGAIVGDVWDPEFLRSQFRRADAVMMLATAIPRTNRAARPKAWLTNDRIRAILAPQVAQIARDAGVRRHVQESLLFVYADGGSSLVTEESPVDPTKHVVSCLTAEHAALRFRQDRGEAVHSAVLRFGLFVAPDSEQTRSMLNLARHGLAPVFGDLDSLTTYLHADDAAAAAVAALDVPSGIYNVGAQAVTKRQVVNDLATALGRRSMHVLPGPIRGFAPRLVPVLQPLARSIGLDSTKLREQGWHPRFDSNGHLWARVVGQLGDE